MTTTDLDSGIIEALHRLYVAIVSYLAWIEVPDYDEKESMRLLDVADAIELEIAAIPAMTTEGFAIKTYLALRAELGEYGNSILAIDFRGSHHFDQTAVDQWSTMRFGFRQRWRRWSSGLPFRVSSNVYGRRPCSAPEPRRGTAAPVLRSLSASG